MNLTITVHREDDEPHQLPARWEICPHCRGAGTRDHPAFSNGVDFSDEDEDFREAYFGGAYDVACGCDAGKVLVPDERRFTAADRAAYTEHQESMRGAAQIAAEHAAERRVGA